MEMNYHVYVGAETGLIKGECGEVKLAYCFGSILPKRIEVAIR